jgi:cyclophilin family peptidyl-prolyl cis-trans isomerase
MSEKDEQAKRFEELRLQAEKAHESRAFSMADFEEDWNQSQVTDTIAEKNLLDGDVRVGTDDAGNRITVLVR